MSVLPPTGTFGSGGDEPWARAVAGGGRLWAVHGDGRRTPLPVGLWAASATAADRRAIAGLLGPVLDIGCGPGRMVRAALDAGLAALGIDVSAAAVRHCRREALPVLHRDVFGRVPRAGSWGAVLLFDGNIGIGGDVPALLARCRDLLEAGGSLVAEVHADGDRDERLVSRVVDARGRTSAPFPWARIGGAALTATAVPLGFRPSAAWTDAGRRFVRLERREDPPWPM